MNIAILVPVCSRNQSYKTVEETPFINMLYPSFNKTKEDGYNYKFFIGYDDDDAFYTENHDKFPNSHKLTGCQNAPATAWNKLADIALADPLNFDYFFQIGDDVVLEKFGWTSHFITKLQENNNIGVVGPCNLTNYNTRVNNNRPFVIENAFISRKHFEIFGYLFHPSIKNWYCDDWLTRIYDYTLSEIQLEYTCGNTIIDTRYSIKHCPEIKELILEGMSKLDSRRAFSYCVYGTQKKYCVGMVKNLQQIKVLFPDYKVFIYLGNDVPQEYIDTYQTFNNVTLIHQDFTGGRITAYRYFVLNKGFDAVFIRDSDSRFGHRDMWCINTFLKNNFKIFTIRDHPYHGRRLMAGQTGFKFISFPNIENDCNSFLKSDKNQDRYFIDQDFIDKYIFNTYKDRVLAFSEFHKFEEKVTMKIPLPRKSLEDFCGNVYLFDEHDNEYTEFTLQGKK